MVSDGTLLAAFRDAFPYVTRLPALEAHLLGQGWQARTAKRPAPLEAYLDLVPLMLRNGTTLGTLATLAKPGAEGELWILLQQFSLGALHQAMVAFYDFGAAAPIAPEGVSAVIGAAPTALRRKGDVAETVWEAAVSGAPALSINLVFSPAGERMPGARIVATGQVTA